MFLNIFLSKENLYMEVWSQTGLYSCPDAMMKKKDFKNKFLKSFSSLTELREMCSGNK